MKNIISEISISGFLLYNSKKKKNQCFHHKDHWLFLNGFSLKPFAADNKSCQWVNWH
jgi:hypothetical protein